MAKSRHTQADIEKILREAEGGCPFHVICRRHGISVATLYRWRAKAARTASEQTERMRALELENRQLRQRVAELSLDYHALRTAIVTETTPEC